jgi:hypothetical protein
MSKSAPAAALYAGSPISKKPSDNARPPTAPPKPPQQPQQGASGPPWWFSPARQARWQEERGRLQLLRRPPWWRQPW